MVCSRCGSMGADVRRKLAGIPGAAGGKLTGVALTSGLGVEGMGQGRGSLGTNFVQIAVPSDEYVNLSVDNCYPLS